MTLAPDSSHAIDVDLHTRPYDYSPLDLERPQIRLLTILPGQFDEQIQCMLEGTELPVHLNEQHGREFEAVSYA